MRHARVNADHRLVSAKRASHIPADSIDLCGFEDQSRPLTLACDSLQQHVKRNGAAGPRFVFILGLDMPRCQHPRPLLRRWVRYLALLASAVPSLANAQTACEQWNVSEGWYALHRNFKVEFQLKQQKSLLSGTGDYTETSQGGIGQKFNAASGPRPLSGTVRGNQIEINTEWGGVYVGTIDDTGRIDGMTFDKKDASSRAAWHSDRRMNCLVRAAAPKPPPIALQNPATDTGKLTSRPSGAAGAIRGDRPAPAQPPVVAQPAAPPRAVGKNCNSGYVHRLARPTDFVCVTAKSQARVATENRTADTRRQPGGGAYGPNTCRSGFVWREAFAGDLICVTPAIRSLVAEENGLAASRARERGG